MTAMRRGRFVHHKCSPVSLHLLAWCLHRTVCGRIEMQLLRACLRIHDQVIHAMVPAQAGH